jgi:hypothetical protein
MRQIGLAANIYAEDMTADMWRFRYVR